MGLALFLPAVALALIAGQVADRFDRRAILLLCYTVAALSAVGLLLLARVGVREIGAIYAVVLLFGVTRAFANPAGQAIVPNLVLARDLGNAIAWHALSWQTATILGPVIPYGWPSGPCAAIPDDGSSRP